MAEDTSRSALEVIAAQHVFGGEMVVVDDSPLWVAWESAKVAWLESKRRRSGGDNTVRAYKTALAQFFDWSQTPPWEVSPALAQEWVRMLSEERGLASASINLKLAALSNFYEFVQRRYVFQTPGGRESSLWPADRANPFDAVERVRVSPYGRATFPTSDELKAMLATINTDCLRGRRDFALIYTIATTCRRCSEVLNLRWGDLRELETGDFAFRYRYKGGDERDAVLNRRAYQAIVAYLREDGRPPETLQDDNYVFVPIDAERILRLRPDASVNANAPISNRTANRILRKYARRAGVDESKAHIHALRHAGARLRVEQQKRAQGGVDYMELMQLLGHSSLAVTQIYSQQVLEDPEDPGGDAAAEALLPRGARRGRKRQTEQEQQLLL